MIMWCLKYGNEVTQKRVISANDYTVCMYEKVHTWPVGMLLEADTRINLI